MGKKDITLKDYFSDRRRYADLLNGSVFCGQQMIKAEELRDMDTVQSKSDSYAVLERINDIAMKQTKGGSIFAVWVVANQEKVDYSMPARVMLQEALAYDKQIKDIKRKNQQDKENTFAGSGEFLSGIKREDRLYPVITLVVYWGEEKWQGAKSLHDMICFGEDNTFAETLKTLVPEYPLHFLNLSEVHDYQNFHSEIKMLFELYDRRNDKAEFYKYLHSNEDCRKIDEETLWALGKMLNINAEKLKNRTISEEGGKSDMCRAIEELIEDGRVEGKAAGVLEGDAARIVKSIESVMKNLKVEAARACEIIGVTIEEYQKAKK
ncbi:MAG: Rpn family recombination-promoting nuclease/putative transposase [Lachnospiraceae bacterium]|nr:Rpn family recombination-promoting nuclease/putative transposase [Lachnospiraceae bacterium]